MIEIRELVLKAVVDRKLKNKVVNNTKNLKRKDLNHYQIQQLIYQQRER
jgi:hypothetical protein